ncbi:MAG: glycine cleavage system aminomethyltransferase GcvT [Acidimicrobiia bacterium]|nr:glycine cleavage system aminomethyltransferase GcvT [Acidimicrobiia bacterium]NNF88028.1 glycine cleavage system aminomethyltransferase GcvT [Acidimicrobiia bacterium]NNL69785.1 glycine cleavage system aminomethyltransferase GcvT [Acidimicrobiia bacterium]RZV40738.1 MAG: glycine cleavage system aminomethyltransferase GcvT [Acidimicrobiia bacterium]
MPASPLDSLHHELGARFVDFGGWSMPVQYESVLDEHRAVREAAGVFDVSHLGRVRVSGAGATDLLRDLFCNDITTIGPGRAQYTMLLNDRAGVVDDIIVWRVAEDDYIVMPNGVNIDDVAGALDRSAPDSVTIAGNREETALLAVQGPEAPDLLEQVTGWRPRRFRVDTVEFGGVSFPAAGTGYTGEPGGELMIPNEHAEGLMRALLAAGGAPAALGARDLLRLEMGYPLWGQDLDEDTSPLEADLAWVVEWDHDFVGKKALRRQYRKGVAKSQVAFEMKGRRIPRTGYPLRAGGSVGTVTSGNFSPILGKGIGLGYLSPSPVFHRYSQVDGDPDPPLEIEIRGEWEPVTLSSTPFIKKD